MVGEYAIDSGNVSIGTVTGSFASPNIGTNIAVTVTAITLAGTAGGNYVIPTSNYPTGLTANIVAAPTLGALSSPGGPTGIAYNGTIAISGGTAPYGSLSTFTLPAGLTASLSGSLITISGTPDGRGHIHGH